MDIVCTRYLQIFFFVAKKFFISLIEVFYENILKLLEAFETDIRYTLH